MEISEEEISNISGYQKINNLRRKLYTNFTDLLYNLIGIKFKILLLANFL